MFSSARTNFRYSGLILASLLAACQAEPDETLEPTETPVSILHELGVPTSFDIAPTSEDGSGSFALAVGVGESGEGVDVELRVASGMVTLWAARGEILMLQGLEVEIADVSLSSDVFAPSGAALTGLRARLAAPVTLEVTEANERIGAIANLGLQAEWTLELANGASYPMSSLRLDDLPFALEVERGESGELEARVVAFRQGTFWSWADRFELSDLVVDLVASR